MFVRKLQDTESPGTLVLQTVELFLQCVSVLLPGVVDSELTSDYSLQVAIVI